MAGDESAAVPHLVGVLVDRRARSKGTPLVALVVEGVNVIKGFRSLAGATNPTEAAPGTIRGDLACEQDLPVIQNLVHGSDSEESAEREIGIWFPGLG